MIDILNPTVQGFIKIQYADTKEVIQEIKNDVLFGNMSMALAHALLGNSNGFLCYLALGNGGAFVGPTGSIVYKPSLGGPNSLVKNPAANLYNTVYVRKLAGYRGNPESSINRVYIPTENYATNYEDILVDITMSYNEPAIGLGPSGTIQQTQLDNSSFVGQGSSAPMAELDPTAFVFNEIALYAGTPNIFPGDSTETVAEVNNFVGQLPNFSLTDPDVKSKLMLTHAVFHPVQKSANRSIEIIYTLRIQMGAV